MARGWRRQAIAAVAAAALAVVCAAGADAQAASKAQKRAAAAKGSKSKKQDPVEAQRAIEAALKQLEAGKADQAVIALSTTLAGGNLPPASMAKALFYRGMAYRQQKKPAQAIADLTSAMWLKGGLSDSDRKDAVRQRAEAYREAGLSETGQPIAPAQPQAATRSASATTGWGAETTRLPTAPAAARAAPATQPSSGGNFFENFFGGPPAPSPPPPPRAPATAAPVAPAPVAAAPVARTAPAPAREARPPQAATSGWSSNTQVRSAAPVVTGALTRKAEGKYRIQLGIVRTQGEADALAARVRQEQATLLASRSMEIDQAVVGSMGSFYRVRLGPFSSREETSAACAHLKGTGLDCLVVTQ
jgi:hypothetical protein